MPNIEHSSVAFGPLNVEQEVMTSTPNKFTTTTTRKSEGSSTKRESDTLKK
jgi:hypothetical protein